MYSIKLILKFNLAIKDNITLCDNNFESDLNAVFFPDEKFFSRLNIIFEDNHIYIKNMTKSRIFLTNGTKLGRFIFSKNKDICLKYTNILNKTSRGEGGFGSTGK